MDLDFSTETLCFEFTFNAPEEAFSTTPFALLASNLKSAIKIQTLHQNSWKKITLFKKGYMNKRVLEESWGDWWGERERDGFGWRKEIREMNVAAIVVFVWIQLTELSSKNLCLTIYNGSLHLKLFHFLLYDRLSMHLIKSYQIILEKKFCRTYSKNGIVEFWL